MSFAKIGRFGRDLPKRRSSNSEAERRRKGYFRRLTLETLEDRRVLSGTPFALHALPGEIDAATQAIVPLSPTVGAGQFAASIQARSDEGFADPGANTYALQTLGVATLSNHATIKTQPPASVAAGTAFTIAVTIVDNVTNKTATSYNGSVTIALANNSSDATLSGALTVTAKKGVATFSGLSLDKVGTGFTIQASAADVEVGTTRALNVTPGAVAKLVLTTAPPTDVAAGIGFGLVVTAYDRFDNLATNSKGSITASAAVKPAGAQNPAGTLTAKSVGGVATFTNIVLKTAGDYTISLAGGSAPKIATAVIHVNPGAASSLAIVAQPPKTVDAGTGFGLTVKVFDAFGNAAVGFTGNLTAAIAKNAGGGALGGTTTVAVVNGMATFTGLTLNKIGNGYTLQVTGVGSKPVATGTLNVSPGAVAKFAVTTQPPSSISAGAIFKVVVSAQDALGNKTTNFNGAVSIALASNPGSGSLGGTLVRNARSGVVTFDNLTLFQSGTGYTLIATASTATATTTAFNVAALQATQLVLMTPPPSDIPVGAGFGLVVKAVDRFGNVATNYAGSATVTLINNSANAALSGASIAQFVSGFATFSNLSLNKIASGYALQVRSGGLPTLTTSTVNAFGQVTLSTENAAPFTSALLTGTLIDPSLPTIVTFTNPYGNEFSVSPTSVDSSGVSFPVPIYMDLTTGAVSSGVYSIRLQQKASSGMVSYGADKKLNVGDVAPTGVAPGYVLNAFLTQMQAFYGDLVTDWQKIGRQASPFTNLSSLISTIQSSQEQIASLYSQLSPLINGQVAGIALTPSVTITRETLIDMDRVLLAHLSDISSIDSQSTLRAFSVAAFEPLQAQALSAGETVDQLVQNAFTAIKNKDGNFERMLPSLNKLKDGLVAASAIVGTVMAGPPGGAAAAKFVNFASNAALLIDGAGLRLAATMIRNGGTLTQTDLLNLTKYSANLAANIYIGSNFEEILHFVGENEVEIWLEKAGKTGPGGLAGAYTGLTAILHTADDLIGPKVREVAQNLAQVVQNGLTPPVISVTGGSLVFDIPLVDSPTLSKTITITNSGDLRSTLSFTATSSLPGVTISGFRNLSGGSSTNLTVSVDPAGLIKGTYVGVITITGDAANNSPVQVQITINVVGAIIGINPSALTMTVIQGQAEQTQAFTVSNVGPTGSILWYTTSTNPQYGNHVQVSGNNRLLPVGASDTYYVTSQANNLSPGTYYDYVFITDLKEPSNSKYVTITINVQAPPAPVIGGTTDVYFTAVQDGPSPAAQAVTISNVGAAGSTLSWTANLPNNRYSMSGGVSPVNAGFYTTATLSVNTAGLVAKTYADTITIYSTNDSRVVARTITVHITITSQSVPPWGAYESGSNGRSSNQVYSISSSQMAIWFYAQPFGISDRFIVTDEFNNVYIDTGSISTVDNGFDVALRDQHPKLYTFTKPAGVTRLRVQVIANSDSSTGWWYKGVAPGNRGIEQRAPVGFFDQQKIVAASRRRMRSASER